MTDIETIRELVDSATVAVSDSSESSLDKARADAVRDDSLARKDIALYLTKSYVWILIFIIFAGLILNEMAQKPLIDIASALSAFSGAYTGVLGFVLGYYFKSGDKGN